MQPSSKKRCSGSNPKRTRRAKQHPETSQLEGEHDMLIRPLHERTHFGNTCIIGLCRVRLGREDNRAEDAQAVR